MQIETVPIDKLNPAEYNPRRDLKPGDPDYDKLKKSIIAFDMVEPLVWNKKSGNLVGGHQRLKVLKELGYTETEVSVVNLSPSKERALNLALNKISGEWDFPLLKDLLESLDTGIIDMEITGFDLGEIEDLMTQFHPDDIEHMSLSERFIVPPFSVLDARQGYWLDRKRAWLSLGIQSELGRGGNLQGLSDSNDEYRYNKSEYFKKRNEVSPGGS